MITRWRYFRSAVCSIYLLLLLLLLLNFITDSLLHTCAGKYADSCPNYKDYNKDTTLVFYSYTTRHEHKAAPSSGNALLRTCFLLQFCLIHLSVASLAFCATYITFFSGVFIVYPVGVIRLNIATHKKRAY